MKLRLKDIGKRPIGGWRFTHDGKEFKTDSLDWRDLKGAVTKFCDANGFPYPWERNALDWINKKLAYQWRDLAHWVPGEEEQDDALTRDVREWVIAKRGDVFTLASRIDAEERAETCRGCKWHVPEFEDDFADAAASALTRGRASTTDCGACAAHGWHCAAAVWIEEMEGEEKIRGCWA